MLRFSFWWITGLYWFLFVCRGWDYVIISVRQRRSQVQDWAEKQKLLITDKLSLCFMATSVCVSLFQVHCSDSLFPIWCQNCQDVYTYIYTYKTEVGGTMHYDLFGSWQSLNSAKADGTNTVEKRNSKLELIIRLCLQVSKGIAGLRINDLKYSFKWGTESPLSKQHP